MARRLLAGGRVERLEWFRSAVGGEVVAPNGRRFSGAYVVGRDGRLAHAECACSPKLRREAPCPHLAALHLSATASSAEGDAATLLPGERFERSLWHRAAEGLYERLGGAWPEHTAGEGRRALRAGDGQPAAWLSAAGRSAPEGALSRLFAPDGDPEGARTPSAGERRLVELSLTDEERLMNRAGAQTRRQALEGSPWWRLARLCFEAFGEGAGGVRLEVDGGRVWLEGRSGNAELRLWLTPEAVDRVSRGDPALLPKLGLRFFPGSARASLRLSLSPDGALVLDPAWLIARGGVRLVLSRSDTRAARHGALLLLAEESGVVPLEDDRRPFAEPEAGAQASLDLVDDYRPSPVGVPLERPTRVPPEEAARFLERHRAELDAWPTDLLSAELAGGLGEPSGAVLAVAGEEPDGRFVVSLDYRFSGRLVPFGEILAARRKKKGVTTAGGVLVDAAHPRFAWADWLGPGAVLGQGRRARFLLSPLDVCRLRSHLPEGHEVSADGEGAADRVRRLHELSPETPPPPAEILGVPLFDFQRNGYAWLWFLYKNGFGGLLCDDMGLGKTHQAIALLLAAAATRGRPGRVLLVCPASVLPHWEAKLEAHAPSLPVRRQHGASREVVPEWEGVVLTTYGTLRNDADRFAAVEADVFVLDEVQSIKNRDTATHAALRSIRARVAVGLTGTPVENSVEELRTLVDFVLPGYLPAEAEFRRSFARPIERGDDEARGRLARLVRPFVLRRTKAQVLSELPEKLEDRRTCSLTPGQKAIYEALLAGPGAALRETLDSSGPVPYLHVFALLTRLKQLCDHPDLLLPPGAPPSGAGSGKWELFVELLDEALGSGLKVVVFSQYLRMLDRMGSHLAGRGIGYETLRGSTADRSGPVRRFRDDPQRRVFLGSLKAAGLGIDLTAASVVVHYDRWWNKAREDQATDRVHRIGQHRGVQVVTIVTEGTVEERIDRIIRGKERLAAELVPEDDAGLLKRFSREELRELLAP